MASGDKKPTVEYNFLSNNCGLKVSNMCLGSMTFGNNSVFPMPGNTDEAGSHAILDRFAELGGNFIDTANNYSDGESEQHIGSWLHKQGDRDRFIIGTKCRFSTNPLDPNCIGLSRKHIIKCLEKSLERLQTNYIDVYQTHCWDSAVPLAETLQTLNDLVRCGKVRYVGGSNLTGWQLQKIVDMNRQNGFPQYVSLQQQYNLLIRGIEYECFDVCKNEGIGILPWSPLCVGLLAGKLNRETKKAEKNTRAAAALGNARMGSIFGVTEAMQSEAYWDVIDKLKEFGDVHNKSIAQVSLRWAVQRKPVSSVIIGVKTVKQLEENMAAGVGWSLTDDQMEELNTVSAFDQPYPYGFIRNLNQIRQHPGVVSGVL